MVVSPTTSNLLSANVEAAKAAAQEIQERQAILNQFAEYRQRIHDRKLATIAAIVIVAIVAIVVGFVVWRW